MRLCANAHTKECLLHEAGIPYPPAVESLNQVLELMQKCGVLEGLDGETCPFVEWASKQEKQEESYGVEEARAAIAEASTIEELMLVESTIAAAANESEEDWTQVISESRERLEALAQEQGLEEITDTFSDKPQVTESGDGRLLVTGAFARVNIPTRNGRLYPQSVWDENKEHIESMLESTKLVGQDNHPFMGDTILSEINIIFKKIWQDGDTMRYEGIIPETRAGKDLKELLDLGVGVELSTRGFGSVEDGEWEGEACTVVQDDFTLHAIDPLMNGAALGTSMTRKEAVGESESHADSLEENTQPSTKERPKMRKRILKMLEQSVRTAGVLGLAEVAESLQEHIDALKAFEAEEGAEFEGALDEATKAIDKATEKFEGVEKEEPVVENTATDANLARLEAIEAKLSEREARETQIAERNAKVEELMAEATDLNDKYSARLREALAKCASSEQVEATYGTLLTVMQEASKVAEAATTAIHVHNGGMTTALTGERRERPETVYEVQEQLVQGFVNESGLQDTGEADFSNPVHGFRVMLENYKREFPYYFNVLTAEGFERHRSIIESTTTSDVAVGAPFILPILRRTYPMLIANELCSVQPMDRPDGKVFWLNALTDSGDARLDVESNFDSTYADHTETNASAKIKLQIATDSISAVSKSLEGTWTTELAQDLQAYHNLNAEAEVLSIASEEIAREINYTILEDMRANATGSTARKFGTTPVSGYTGREWDQRMPDFISRMCGDIAEKVYRRPNWIVCDPATASRFSALNVYRSAKPDEQASFGIGVEMVGVMSEQWKVYSVGWFTNNTIMCGYKGTDWKDTGYIFSPYILAYLSPQAYNTSTLVASRATLTRYGKYMANGDMFGYVTIANEQGVDLV